jgi:hypothetical protein
VGLKRSRFIRRAVGALALAAGVGAVRRPLAAQGLVRSARFEVHLTANDGSATVRAEYDLDLPDTRALIPLEVLGFGDATVDDFTVGGASDRLVLWPASGTRRVATVWLDGQGGGAGRARLVLRYRVATAVRGADAEAHTLVPLLGVAWPPASGATGVFSAELRVPDGWRLSDAFPSGLRPDADGVYRVELPVVPAVVRFEVRTDGAWQPGLALVLDVLAGLILIAFGVVGFRHMRSVVG